MDDNPSQTHSTIDNLADGGYRRVSVVYAGHHSVELEVDEVHQHQASRDFVDCYTGDPPASWATGYCRLEIGDNGGLVLEVGDPEAPHPLGGTSQSHEVLQVIPLGDGVSDGD